MTSSVQRGVLPVSNAYEPQSPPAPKESVTPVFKKIVIGEKSAAIPIPSKKVEMLTKPIAASTFVPVQDIQGFIPTYGGGIFPIYLQDSDEESFENVTTAPTPSSPQIQPFSPIENYPLPPKSSPPPLKTALATTKVYRDRIKSPVQKENVVPRFECTSRESKDNFRRNPIAQAKQLAKAKQAEPDFLQFHLET